MSAILEHWKDGFKNISLSCICGGTLTNVINTKTWECFKKCFACKKEFSKIPISDLKKAHVQA